MEIDGLKTEIIEQRKRERASTEYLPLKVTVTVNKNSYLHIGAAEAPLREKKGPVFTIQGRPVIPATSFKGAWRVQMEDLVERNWTELAQKLGSADKREAWQPCIPSPAKGVAVTEKKEFEGRRKLASCQVTIEESGLKINDRTARPKDPAICPVCYFFGANGLPGFLRVANLMLPEATAESGLYDQTRTRRTRGSVDGVAGGALVTLVQVEPGTQFVGEMELTLKSNRNIFGQPRRLDNNTVDLWLRSVAESQLAERRLLLLKDLLLPSLLNVRVLGGMRSMKAGNVEVSFDIPEA